MSLTAPSWQRAALQVLEEDAPTAAAEAALVHLAAKEALKVANAGRTNAMHDVCQQIQDDCASDDDCVRETGVEILSRMTSNLSLVQSVSGTLLSRLTSRQLVSRKSNRQRSGASRTSGYRSPITHRTSRSRLTPSVTATKMKRQAAGSRLCLAALVSVAS
jgi:uncharacterized protein YcbK (DUF882 family)